MCGAQCIHDLWGFCWVGSWFSFWLNRFSLVLYSEVVLVVGCLVILATKFVLNTDSPLPVSQVGLS